MPAEFENSRTAAMIDAEAARRGPQPVAAMVLLITGLVETGAPWDFVVRFGPTALQAVVLARGERDETVKDCTAMLKALMEDLSDARSGRL